MQQLTLTQAPTPAQQALLNNLKPNTKWVAGRKIKLVEKFENRATHSFSDTVHHTGTITYMDPAVFDVKSSGSLPCGDFNHMDECDSDLPANVSDIQKVRLMVAREMYRTPKVDVNLSAWELGQFAAQAGHGPDVNPYEVFDHGNFSEWMDGFDEYR